MQGAFNMIFTPNLYQEQTQRLINVYYSNPNQQLLLSTISDQKIIIQKLLENQNILQARFEYLLRLQTTDTEHSPFENDESQSSVPIIEEFVQNKKTCVITDSADPSRNNTHRNNSQTGKKQIQIICSSPHLCNSQIAQEYKQQNKQNQQKKQYEMDAGQTKKSCETKNVIKNYGKSILTFMRKNKDLTQNILKSNKYDKQQFQVQFNKFRGKVNSITDLKEFWTNQGSSFGKVFRIISNIYLKRHSLKHTFSSRVRNYGIHIKYRNRLLDVLRDPSNLSSIKYI